MSKENRPEKQVKVWLEKVEEDYGTAKDLLKSGRYTWCAFACQQFLEKYLKAAYVKTYKKIPPYTHSLLKLSKELKLEIPENFLDTLTTIDKYYLAARYPAYKESVNIPNREQAENFFKRAEEVFGWLKETLSV